MSKIRLYGATSGYVDLAAPAVADDATLTLPTGAAGFVPGNGGIGSNVVSALKTDAYTSTSTSLEDVPGLSVTITPTSSSSKVLLIASITINSNASGNPAYVRIVRGSPITFSLFGDDDGASRQRGTFAIAGGTTGSGPRTIPALTMVWLDSPATASAEVYTVRAKVSGGGSYSVNRAPLGTDTSDVLNTVSTLTAIEVAG